VAYTEVRAITIAAAKVPNTDQANFPVLILETLSYLKSVANGGSVQHASGYDIAFFSDLGLTSALKFERVIWNASTGAVEFWVKVPTVSHTVDTVIYLAYGNASIVTDQADPANVWTNSFGGVLHLGDGVTLSAADATGLTADGSISGAVAAAGQIVGGGSFAAPPSADQLTTNIILEPDQATYSWWYKSSQTVSGGLAPRIWCKGLNSVPGTFMQIIDTVDGLGAGLPPVPCLIFYRMWLTQDAYWYVDRPSVNVWHKIDVTYDRRSSANDPIMYVDGDPASVTEFQQPLGTIVSDDTAPDGKFALGNRAATGNRGAGSLIDEWQVASVTRSADWIKSSYNNQFDPSTFYSISSPVSGQRFLLSPG
jgi:hypothetical protein